MDICLLASETDKKKTFKHYHLWTYTDADFWDFQPYLTDTNTDFQIWVSYQCRFSGKYRYTDTDYNNYWSSPTTHHTWWSMTIHDQTWLSISIQTNNWPNMTILDHTWPYLTIHDHAWPYMTMHDHTWPFMTIQVHPHISTENCLYS